MDKTPSPITKFFITGLAFCGLASFIYGVSMIYPPLGWISGGVFAVAYAATLLSVITKSSA